MDDFDQIIGMEKRVVGVSRSMASAAFPKAATLRCTKCGATRAASTEDCARYLSTGWPEHCRETMAADAVSGTGDVKNG